MAHLANFIVDDMAVLPFRGEPVPKSVALRLIQHYRDTGGWSSGGTRAIWFSKNDFIQILSMIASINGGDGMRVYLGRYPDEKLPGDYDHVKCKQRATVVFVPTKNGKIDIFDINQPAVDSTLMARGGEGPDDGFNHGELHP